MRTIKGNDINKVRIEEELKKGRIVRIVEKKNDEGLFPSYIYQSDDAAVYFKTIQSSGLVIPQSRLIKDIDKVEFLDPEDLFEFIGSLISVVANMSLDAELTRKSAFKNFVVV